MTHTENQINARCHLQVSKALEMINELEAADRDRELAYEYAHSSGFYNEPLPLTFRCDPFLLKAYRDGSEDAMFLNSQKKSVCNESAN